MDIKTLLSQIDFTGAPQLAALVSRHQKEIDEVPAFGADPAMLLNMARQQVLEIVTLAITMERTGSARTRADQRQALGMGVEQLTFSHFSRMSLQRCARWHAGGIAEWSESEWSNAMGGEAGEAALAMVSLLSKQLHTAMTALTMLGNAGESMNTAKKLLRLMKGNQQHDGDSAVPKSIEEARRKVAKEIGDTVSYCDLVCARVGWTLEDALRLAFNGVSEREGFPERL